MAELKPTINKINAFDAEIGTTISFEWTGAQSFANELLIYDYETNELVYDCKQSTMAWKHTIHLTTDTEDKIEQKVTPNLKNGKRYFANIYVYDRYDKRSEKSNPSTFYCFKTPEFSFDEDRFESINQDGIAKLTSNSAYLNVTYKQADGELINEYRFVLYDSNRQELLHSKIVYGTTNEGSEEEKPQVTCNLPYTLPGALDTEKNSDGTVNYDAAYCISCEATTLHGMSLYTEQPFVVQRDTGGVGSLITLESLSDHTIAISSHFKIVNANVDGEEKYIQDINGDSFALDLSGGESLLYFDGFNMSYPWDITAIAGNCQQNTTLMKCSNNKGESFTISYIVKRYPLSEKAYFLFEATKQTTYYFLASDYLPISDKWYVIYLSYKDGMYVFKVCDPEDIGYEVPQTLSSSVA